MAARAATVRGVERPAIPPILEEHLEESAFLWLQRRRRLFSADVPLRRMPEHDERIAAHLDALTIGGRTSVAVALARIEDENPWIASAAIRTWLELADVDGPTAFARVDTMGPPFAASWVEALRWTSDAVTERLLPDARVARLP